MTSFRKPTPSFPFFVSTVLYPTFFAMSRFAVLTLIILALSRPAASFTATQLHACSGIPALQSLSRFGATSAVGFLYRARPPQCPLRCCADRMDPVRPAAPGRREDPSGAVRVKVERALDVGPEEARAAWLSYQWAGGGGLPVSSTPCNFLSSFSRPNP